MEYVQDYNDIIKIEYRGLSFEIDMINDILFLPEDVIELFAKDSNVESQPVNLFFRRLIDNWNLKKKIELDNDTTYNIE
jgi:hypothetical protein